MHFHKKSGKSNRSCEKLCENISVPKLFTVYFTNQFFAHELQVTSLFTYMLLLSLPASTGEILSQDVTNFGADVMSTLAPGILIDQGNKMKFRGNKTDSRLCLWPKMVRKRVKTALKRLLGTF